MTQRRTNGARAKTKPNPLQTFFRPMTAQETECERSLVALLAGRFWSDIAKVLERKADADVLRPMFESMILDHGIHPQAVLDFFRDCSFLPEGPLAAEVFRCSELVQASPTHLKSSVFRIARTSEQQLSVDQEGRWSGLDDVVTRLEHRARLPEAERKKLVLLLDVPPGLGKTTCGGPTLTTALKARLHDQPLSAVTYFRETQDGVVETERLLNAASQDDLEHFDQAAFQSKVLKLRVLEQSSAQQHLQQPRRQHVGDDLDSQFGTVSYAGLQAHGAFGWPGEARCEMAQALDEHHRKGFIALKKRAKGTGTVPCFAGCPKVICRAHPGALAHASRLGFTGTVVRAHETNHASPSYFGLYDEGPHDIIDTQRLTIRVGYPYQSPVIDRIYRVVRALGRRDLLPALKDVKDKLVDAAGQARGFREDVYREFKIPHLKWSDADFEAIRTAVKALADEPVRSALTEHYKCAPESLGHRISDDLHALRVVLAGERGIWKWQANRKEITVVRAVNRWREILEPHSAGLVVLDGTGSISYPYLAVPPDIDLEVVRLARREHRGVRFTFGTKSITKGVRDTYVAEQCDYALECLARIGADRGDVLVVTHEAAESELLERLRASVAAMDYEVVAGATARPDIPKPVIFVTHFGAHRSQNAFRSCRSVIITHKHNLPDYELLARAQATFGTLSIECPDESGRTRIGRLPRQWTAVRRGKTGKHAHDRGLVSAKHDEDFCREVAFVRRSYLAAEIVQVIHRTEIRVRPDADVQVFVPLGNDTELAAMILREFPGASHNLPTRDRVSDIPADLVRQEFARVRRGSHPAAGPEGPVTDSEIVQAIRASVPEKDRWEWTVQELARRAATEIADARGVDDRAVAQRERLIALARAFDVARNLEPQFLADMDHDRLDSIKHLFSERITAALARRRMEDVLEGNPFIDGENVLECAFGIGWQYPATEALKAAFRSTSELAPAPRLDMDLRWPFAVPS